MAPLELSDDGKWFLLFRTWWVSIETHIVDSYIGKIKNKKEILSYFYQFNAIGYFLFKINGGKGYVYG